MEKLFSTVKIPAVFDTTYCLIPATIVAALRDLILGVERHAAENLEWNQWNRDQDISVTNGEKLDRCPARIFSLNIIAFSEAKYDKHNLKFNSIVTYIWLKKSK